MQCEVFMCVDEATHKVRALTTFGAMCTFYGCTPHATGEKRFEEALLKASELPNS